MSKSEAKALLRVHAMQVRESAHAEMSAHAPEALAAALFPVDAKAGAAVVSAFFPYQSEIDTRPLLARLAGEGWTPCLPVVIAARQPLVFRQWYPGEPTVTGKWNIPVPPEDNLTVQPDTLLVPLLAFDRQGFRLGYGGGFYDRTLAKLRASKAIVAIGVAYAAQEVADVPRDETDQPLDFVMTEREVFRCG